MKSLNHVGYMLNLKNIALYHINYLTGLIAENRKGFIQSGAEY
jgi:hypothetical protein